MNNSNWRGQKFRERERERERERNTVQIAPYYPFHKCKSVDKIWLPYHFSEKGCQRGLYSCPL